MKCPRCGREMVIDSHRKMDMFMCYDCGYIENRLIEDETPSHATNFQRLAGMNFNEAISFISNGLGVEEDKISNWMGNHANAVA